RCFPHVINIATQTFLRYAPNPVSTASGITDLEYQAALLLDPLGHARKIVTWCRASGSRREGLSEAIKDGNAGKLFKVRKVGLARDEPTRWDSTHFMGTRFLELSPAIKFFLNRQEQESDSSKKPPDMLSEMELRVLKDIQQALKVPHLAQQALSSERTPTLSSVLRAYDLIIRGWELLASSLPNLKHAISAGLEKIRKYEQKSRQNQMFVLAIGMTCYPLYRTLAHVLYLALNPSMKLEWIEDKWGGTEAPAARMSLHSAVSLSHLFL
ncbi:hypothetical protein M407DRAFT_80291, partial [Tulasnella calospora MUT 4182]